MLAELENYRVDWRHLDQAHRQNSAFLRALASDQAAMRDLVERVPSERTLWDMCEHNRLFDKVVLHDAPDRGFRIRLHIWSNNEVAAAHDHRWSFTTRILLGGYEHVLYDILDLPGVAASAQAQGDRHLAVVEKFRTTQRAGDSYTIHHASIHSTTTSAHTVTLLVRGPAEKSKSRRMDPATGKIWYGVGRKDQTAADIARRQMTADQYDRIRKELDGNSII
jgi:hypothetical protein